METQQLYPTIDPDVHPMEALNKIMLSSGQFAANFSYINFQSRVHVRTYSWSVLVGSIPTAAQYIRTPDMDSSQPEFCSLVKDLASFYSQPNQLSFALAVNSFSQFTEKYWLGRPVVLQYLKFFCECSDRLILDYRHYRVHMASLMDGDFTKTPQNKWQKLQYFHAALVFPERKISDIFSDMEAVSQLDIEESLKVFKGHSTPHLCYISCYVEFLKDHRLVTKTVINNAMTCFIPDERMKVFRGEMTVSMAVHLFPKRVIQSMFDARSTYHDVAVRLPPFYLENYYADLVPFMENRDEVVTALVNLHLTLWAPFYTNVLLGL